MGLLRRGSGRVFGEGGGTARAGWLLALSGLVPFFALTGLLGIPGQHLVDRDRLLLALSGYAAAILSFLGGIRWGATLPRTEAGGRTLVLSVVPSLLAWAFLLVPAPARFLLFAAAFVGQGVLDVGAARRGALPAWFGTLRIVLTVAVTFAMLAAFLATWWPPLPASSGPTSLSPATASGS